jgi:hypothetical protein
MKYSLEIGDYGWTDSSVLNHNTRNTLHVTEHLLLTAFSSNDPMMEEREAQRSEGTCKKSHKKLDQDFD